MKHIALGQKQKLISRRTKPEMASNTLLCLILVSLTSVASIAPLPPKHFRLFSRQRSRSADQAPCGGDVTVNGTGFIKSPRFPLNYPVDILCEWKLCVKQGSRITLKFTDFEMEPTQGCSFDALEVFSGDSTDVNNRLAKLCGNELPDPIVSTSHELLIRFRSDFRLQNEASSYNMKTQVAVKRLSETLVLIRHQITQTTILCLKIACMIFVSPTAVLSLSLSHI
ncbi:tolloid-like protein 1 [Acropora muricata]|uniref:tolloid-like protein 1 n=1 Tax=Acropora muricata TaxID=159855 RepID=UPI0034E5169B